MEDKLKKFVVKRREDFDTFVPSEEVWNRLQGEITKKQSRRRIITMKTGLVAASVAAILCIVAISLFVQDQNGQKIENHVVSRPSVKDPNVVMEQVEDNMKTALGSNHPTTIKLANTSSKEPKRVKPVIPQSSQDSPSLIPSGESREMLALLDDNKSAVNRMKGLLQVREAEDISPEILEKLQQTIMSDPNSNVRLVALELFMDVTPATERAQKLQELFVEQDDASLQMEFIQVFNQNDSLDINTATASRLKEITEDPFAIDILKEQAYVVLMKTWE